MPGINTLYALIKSKNVMKFYGAKLKEEMFLEGTEKVLYTAVHQHLSSYGVLPDEFTVTDGGTLPHLPEPFEYYLAQLEDRYAYKVVQRAINESASLIEDDPKKVIDLYQAVVDELTEHSNRQNVLELVSEGASLIKTLYKNTLLEGEGSGIRLGLPSVDLLSGGLKGGDIVSLVGRPGAGKSWVMLNAAMTAWRDQRVPILVVSMEMNTNMIVQRLASLYVNMLVREGVAAGVRSDFLGNSGGGKSFVPHYSFSDIKDAGLTSIAYEAFVKNINTLGQTFDGSDEQLPPFYILDGNLKSDPHEIFALVRQYGVGSVYIDGAYLLTNANKKLDRFTKVSENIEEIKKLSSIADIPAICTFQFNRMGVVKVGKDGKKEKPGLEHIAYSDAIGQVSSVVLGMFNNDEEDIEQIKTRTISILKGRNGEVGEFDINWDFKGMNFSEGMYMAESNKSNVNASSPPNYEEYI